MKSQYEADQPRFFYWLPVALGLGIACYFIQASEPSALACIAFLCMAAMGVGIAYHPSGRFYGLKPWALLALFFMLGIVGAQLRTAMVDTRFLQDKLGPIRVVGTIESLDRQEQGGRITLSDLQFEHKWRKVDAENLPRTIRIKVRKDLEALQIGDRISALVLLSAPNEPAMPGGYDFARQLYFDGIGGVGFSLGSPKLIEHREPDRWRGYVNLLRDNLIVGIKQYLQGDSAAVSAALITSEQSGVSKDTMQILRQSGLQHILSVSGLHLTLMGGFVFFLIRFLLIWFPSMAIPSKKIAAAGGLGATFFYLVISGFDVPTQRSFVMVGLVFLAILADREGISMRLVAISALIILLLRPESLLNVGFQLSFAAVVALVAVYENWQKSEKQKNIFFKIAQYFWLAAMTSFVASVATAPIIAYHFHQFTLQAILANCLTAPLMSFWIMPLVVVILMAWPFGLQAYPILLMGMGVDWLLRIASAIAAMPGSMIMLPAVSTASILWIIAGGLWLLLWVQHWRYLGLVPIAVGCALAFAQHPLPDIAINGSASLFGVQNNAQQLLISSIKRDKFTAKIWNAHFGQSQTIAWQDDNVWDGGSRQMRCDSLGCIYTAGNRTVLFAYKPQVFDEDCGSVDVIITALRAPESCASDVVLDRNYFEIHGATTIWLQSDGEPRVESVREARGKRPWTAWGQEDDEEPDIEDKGAVEKD